MKKSILLVLVLAFGLVNEKTKADFTWTQKADMPTGRWTQTSAVVNGKIYVIGGYPSEGTPGESALSVVEEYDLSTNTWTRKADMPTARCDFNESSPVVDGKIYVIGGTTYPGPVSSAVEEYDPATDTWTQKADMPTPRWSLGTCAVDGKIYAIGGYPHGAYVGLKTVEVYDPATDTWTRKADMPGGVAMLSARVVRGKIYAIGGRTGTKSGPYMQEYDPSTDTWTWKANMLVATSQMGSVVFGDKIIVIGGWLWSMDYPYTTVQVYNPDTDRWTMEADTPFLRAASSAEVVRGRIFAIGGTDRPHPCPATSTVYECDIGYIPQLCDFNSDGIVDSSDMCIMIDHWGEDYPLCDIGPIPWGDNVVDVQDLIVLASRLFDDYRTLAQWKLDEKEGNIAHDYVGGYDATLHGEPLWQPGGGQIVGALEFDGINDYISTDFILDPSLGAFSVFAWIQGGAPGQAIISQLTGAGNIWLGLDAQNGALMTGLVPPSAGWTAKKPLVSESLITDDQWHHVGFVWDGSYRILYVDGIEVAKDTAAQNPLKPADGGLYIGADKTLGAGTFFSGLIDDVRIYNQALTAEQIAALAQ